MSYTWSFFIIFASSVPWKHSLSEYQIKTRLYTKTRGFIWNCATYHEPPLDTLIKLNQAPVTTLHVERTVGSINYELGIRGKDQLNVASKKVMIKKSVDQIKLLDFKYFQRFQKPRKDVDHLKLSWKCKVKQQEVDVYTKKEQACLSK